MIKQFHNRRGIRIKLKLYVDCLSPAWIHALMDSYPPRRLHRRSYLFRVKPSAQPRSDRLPFLNKLNDYASLWHNNWSTMYPYLWPTFYCMFDRRTVIPRFSGPRCTVSLGLPCMKHFSRNMFMIEKGCLFTRLSIEAACWDLNHNYIKTEDVARGFNWLLCTLSRQ